MKPAFIVAVVLAFAIYLTPRCEAKQNAGNKAHATNPDTPQPGVVVFNESESHPAKHNEAANNQPPHWYKRPEWILVIIGGITAFVIGWQSFETRRAANASAVTAKAALNNSQALVEAERARIDIDLVPFGALVTYQVKATNHGRSIARVVKITFARFYYGSQGEKLPDRTPETQVMNHILKSGDSLPIFMFTLGHFLSDDEQQGKTKLEVALIVDYFDVFDQTVGHVTEVRYVYSPATFTLNYIPKHTKYT